MAIKNLLWGLGAACGLVAVVGILWFTLVYARPGPKLVRACEAKIQMALYVPGSAKFTHAFIDPQPVRDYVDRIEASTAAGDVATANALVKKAQPLKAGRLGEIHVFGTAKNRMGVPVGGVSTCTYPAAPDFPGAMRADTVVLVDTDSSTGIAPTNWFGRLKETFHLARANVMQTANPPSLAGLVTPTWRYSDEKMGLSGRTKRFALLDSTNNLALSAPYDDPQTAKLAIAQVSSYFEVSVHVNGQFQCYDSCRVEVKFDDQKPIFVNAEEERSGRYDFLDFGLSSIDLVSSMLKAKRMQVQLPIYNNGLVLADFHIAGLDPSKLTDETAAAKAQP